MSKEDMTSRDGLAESMHSINDDDKKLSLAKQFKCSVCPQVLSSAALRTKHLKTHPMCLQTDTGHVIDESTLPDEIKEAPCQICKKRVRRGPPQVSRTTSKDNDIHSLEPEDKDDRRNGESLEGDLKKKSGAPTPRRRGTMEKGQARPSSRQTGHEDSDFVP
jgi:hypothetical protein